MTPSQCDTGAAAALWLGMSDHRPVVASYGGLLALGSRERFTRAYSQARTLHISGFRPSPKQLKDYQDALETSWVHLDGPPSSPFQEDRQLQHLTDISLTASLTRTRWKVRSRYKEHLSPTYAALQAQLVEVIRIQRHLGILTIPPRLRKWESPQEISQGIANEVWEWEKPVSSLTFHGGSTPPESLPTSAPALHDDGTLSWDDIAHGSFEDFRRHYSSLNIPLSDGDRPDTLHVLWQALRTSPRRDRVQAELQDHLTAPPSLDEFTAILHDKAGHSSGGPSGLQYKHRLGVPLDIAQWLVGLDDAGYAIVHTPPFTWLAVFDVLLTMLEQTPSSEHHFLLRHPDGSLYVARVICFADDLQSFGSTLEGLQRTADLFSTYAMGFNLSIASHKLRAFNFRGLASPPTDPPYILVHAPGWIPHPVYLTSEGTSKSLGVEYPINPGNSTSFTAMKQKLLVSIRAISIKKASARAVNTVIAKCLYNWGAYVGVLSSWSLAQCEELDKILPPRFAVAPEHEVLPT
eukprot:gene36396-biopygen4136